jgi:hypothetical protein
MAKPIKIADLRNDYEKHLSGRIDKMETAIIGLQSAVQALATGNKDALLKDCTNKIIKLTKDLTVYENNLKSLNEKIDMINGAVLDGIVSENEAVQSITTATNKQIKLQNGIEPTAEESLKQLDYFLVSAELPGVHIENFYIKPIRIVDVFTRNKSTNIFWTDTVHFFAPIESYVHDGISRNIIESYLLNDCVVSAFANSLCIKPESIRLLVDGFTPHKKYYKGEPVKHWAGITYLDSAKNTALQIDENGDKVYASPTESSGVSIAFRFI